MYFLYFWQTPIFEPARAILLKRVWYQEFQPEGLVPYQKSIFFWKVEIFLAHLNHLRKLYFLIFYTFWFVKKMGKIEKKTLFPVFGPKGFLYFWWTPIFEPNRAILLRRVRYQPLRLKFRVPYPPQQNGSSRLKYMCLSKV